MGRARAIRGTRIEKSDADLGDPHDGDGGEDHPQEVAAGVAHEGSCRREVEDEEPQAHPHQRRAQDDHSRLEVTRNDDPVDRRQHRHQGHDRDHPGGDAVGAVHEVDRHLHPGHPEDGHREGEEAELDQVASGKVDGGDADPEQVEGHPGAHHDDQLLPPDEVDDVVDRHDQGDHPGDGEDRPAGLDLAAEGDHRDDVAEQHGQPAQPRGGGGMEVALVVRVGHRSDPRGQAHGEGDSDDADGRGEQEGRKGREPG